MYQMILNLFWGAKPTSQYFLGERWQYAALPATFTDSGSTSKNWESDGFVMSGAVMYDHRATNFSNAYTAIYKEGESLDPANGHSSPDAQYHYHGVSKMA